MGLKLIIGPPNSGRAGRIRRELEAALPRDPLLVVPTLDDTDQFERELCEGPDGGAVLGVSILTFNRLFDEVGRATGALAPASLTDAQKLFVARVAIARARPRILARSAQRSGFAAALTTVIGEFQAGCLDPGAVERAAAEGSDPKYLLEIASMYREYADLRDELGFGDEHVAASAATAALRANSDAWGSRPVFLYGFDDLSVEQIQLIAALADAAEVTVAVPYEDRSAFAARAGLERELRERGAKITESRDPEPEHTESPILRHLERNFLVEPPERRELDPGLVLMEGAGERGQAEQIAGEVSRLLAEATDPDQIAIVLRTPNRHGRLYESVLASYGIPVAVEAEIPFAHTAVGRGMLALLRAAFTSRRADDVLAFLRTPGRARPADADWLERSIRRRRLRTADEALNAWNGRELFELADIRAADASAALLRTLARLGPMFAEYPYEGDGAPSLERERRLEVRAGALAAEAMDGLAGLPDGAIASVGDAVAEATACLESLQVSLWRGPMDGHVRVTSPYRVRARRFSHLFVSSLQEGEFPRHESGEPFLSDEQREELGLAARADPEDEERYLFYVCISRPTKRLYLCWRSCDDAGGATGRSPLLDDVRDLLDPADPGPDHDDPLEEEIRRRTLADVIFAPANAPSIDEVVRSLAARPTNGDRVPAALELDEATSAAIEGRLAAGDAAANAALDPGPLAVPEVIDELRGRRVFGASTLEEYALCSYRWFVQHELSPQSIDPDPEPLAQGHVVHQVLEKLYSDPPLGEPSPSPETLPDWERRVAKLVAAEADEAGLRPDDPGCIVTRARMEALIGGFLAREAASPTKLRPGEELLEASFGEGERDSRPPLDLGGFLLHGKIDRVDVPADGESAGLIRDYKVSRTVTAAAKLAEKGKLQLQLYALALRDLWGRRPLGGLYQPLAATDDHRPRGLLHGDERDRLLTGLDVVNRDVLDEEEFERMLDQAAERAAEIVGAMRAGQIDRNPIDDECPPFCTFQTICRRERSARQEPEEIEEEDEEE